MKKVIVFALMFNKYSTEEDYLAKMQKLGFDLIKSEKNWTTMTTSIIFSTKREDIEHLLEKVNAKGADYTFKYDLRTWDKNGAIFYQFKDNTAFLHSAGCVNKEWIEVARLDYTN